MIRYPVGTRVRVSWAAHPQPGRGNGSWQRVPFEQGLVGELAVPKDRYNMQSPAYVWVQLDPDQGKLPTESFSPGGWEDEGELWQLEQA